MITAHLLKKGRGLATAYLIFTIFLTLTNVFSLDTLPLIRNKPTIGSKSTFSTVIVSVSRIRWLVLEPVELSDCSRLYEASKSMFWYVMSFITES